MLTLAMLAVLAAPVYVEVLGFAVEVKGDAVEVITVEPNSAAAKAGLVPGVQLARPSSPIYLFGRSGPFAQLNERDLRDWLTPSWGEPLIVRGTVGATSRTYAMARTDPEPQVRFPEIPLPKAKLLRLSVREQARYYHGAQHGHDRPHAGRASEGARARPLRQARGRAQPRRRRGEPSARRHARVAVPRGSAQLQL